MKTFIAKIGKKAFCEKIASLDWNETDKTYITEILEWSDTDAFEEFVREELPTYPVDDVIGYALAFRTKATWLK